jgi:hypothetical protein
MRGRVLEHRTDDPRASMRKKRASIDRRLAAPGFPTASLHRRSFRLQQVRFALAIPRREVVIVMRRRP